MVYLKKQLLAFSPDDDSELGFRGLAAFSSLQQAEAVISAWYWKSYQEQERQTTSTSSSSSMETNADDSAQQWLGLCSRLRRSNQVLPTHFLSKSEALSNTFMMLPNENTPMNGSSRSIQQLELLSSILYDVWVTALSFPKKNKNTKDSKRNSISETNCKVDLFAECQIQLHKIGCHPSGTRPVGPNLRHNFLLAAIFEVPNSYITSIIV